MKIAITFVAIVLLNTASVYADRPADFCDKHPDHKVCQPSQPNGDGYCPEGTIYIDTWGCVNY